MEGTELDFDAGSSPCLFCWREDMGFTRIGRHEGRHHKGIHPAPHKQELHADPIAKESLSCLCPP